MSTNRNFHIISIDDNPRIAGYLQQSAEKVFEQAHIHAIHSVDQLVQYLKEPASLFPRLILLDIHLFQRNAGFELVRTLRNHPILRLIPIIILTASDDRGDIENAYLQGANAYMVKPEDYKGWLNLMKMVKSYWYNTVSIPTQRSITKSTWMHSVIL